MDSIRDGKLTATVDVNSIEMGTTMIDTLFQHEVLGMSVSQFVRIPTVVVDKANVDWAEGLIADAMAGAGTY
jgi:ribose transport system substrate-binding protein